MDAKVSLRARLVASHPSISKIRSITGNAGLSVGVLHYGEVIHLANFGYRDIETKTPPDSDTVYHINSMTKALTSAAFAILVDEGKVAWTSRIPSLVPYFAAKNTQVALPELKTDANLVDLLAHRLGLTQRNMFRMQSQNQLLMEQEDTPLVVSELQVISPFRSTMTYNSWTYGLAGMILEDITKNSIGAFCTSRIFGPLGLSRTTLGNPPPDNYVSSYMTLSNATSFRVPPPQCSDGKLNPAECAGKSTINDLMTLYKSLMEAAAHQSKSGGTRTPNSPFRRVEDMWKSHVVINDDSTYGLGWVLTKIPAKGGLIGLNAYEADAMPIIGKGIQKGPRMIYHQGSGSGTLSAVYLLPDTHSAVVVLANSIDLSDTPDWVAQLLVEILIGSPKPNNYVALAKNASANALLHIPAMNDKLASERIPNTSSRELSFYTGRYRNRKGNFFVDVSTHDNGLRLTVQGFRGVFYDLYHYHYDIFAWDGDRDAEAKQALFPMANIGFHKIRFEGEQDGLSTSLVWALDKNIPAGEIFYRQETSRLEKI